MQALHYYDYCCYNDSYCLFRNKGILFFFFVVFLFSMALFEDVTRFLPALQPSLFFSDNLNRSLLIFIYLSYSVIRVCCRLSPLTTVAIETTIHLLRHCLLCKREDSSARITQSSASTSVTVSNALCQKQTIYIAPPSNDQPSTDGAAVHL